MTSSSVGQWAEDRAARFLESKGFRIFARNFRTRFGEVDLVAEDGESLVLIEVKYRADESFSPVEESLTFAKRKKLIKAGRAAAARFGENRMIRFDFVALVGSRESPELRHYENVLEGATL